MTATKLVKGIFLYCFMIASGVGVFSLILFFIGDYPNNTALITICQDDNLVLIQKIDVPADTCNYYGSLILPQEYDDVTGNIEVYNSNGELLSKKELNISPVLLSSKYDSPMLFSNVMPNMKVFAYKITNQGGNK